MRSICSIRYDNFKRLNRNKPGVHREFFARYTQKMYSILTIVDQKMATKSGIQEENCPRSTERFLGSNFVLSVRFHRIMVDSNRHFD